MEARNEAHGHEVTHEETEEGGVEMGASKQWEL